MDAGKLLIEAQMHLECMNEALLEMEGGILDKERQKTAYHELLSRLWASIHLIQSVRMGRPDEGLEQARREVMHYSADAPGAQDLH